MDLHSVEALNARFALPGLAEVVAGEGGLTKISLNTPTAKGEIYLHGAHIAAWQPKGEQEVLYMSPRSLWQPGKAIRGGIPICAPWFGDHPENPAAPKHGLARVLPWQLENIAAEKDTVTVTLSLDQAQEFERWWPHPFSMRFEASFGQELKLAFTYTNRSSDAITLGEALHTYYAVGDIQRTRIHGLDHLDYYDKVANQNKTHVEGPIEFRGATDNVYLNATGPVTIEDTAGNRTIQLEKSGSATTVVWNPWEQGAASMADMGQDQWPHFVCVEPSNALACRVSVAPGESHTISATMRIQTK